MEHKLIQGGEIYLPFARSRIKALRACGLEYASQRFVMPDGEVHVQIIGDHEYIRLSGGIESILSGITKGGVIATVDGKEVLQTYRATPQASKYVKGGSATVFHDMARLAVEEHGNIGLAGVSQYDKVCASMYSGTMAKVVQILMGYGKTKAAPDIGVQVKYMSDWDKCHGVTTGADGKKWLIEISSANGVMAMLLPMYDNNAGIINPATHKQDVIKQTYLLLGGFPNGETFPDGAALTAAIAAGTVLQLLSAASMATFFDKYPLSAYLGWSFNNAGSEAHNTCCWSSNGVIRGAGAADVTSYHYKLAISIGAIIAPPANPIAVGSATLSLVESGPLLWGGIERRFAFYAPALASFEQCPGKQVSVFDSSLDAASSAPILVCHINNVLEVVRIVSNDLSVNEDVGSGASPPYGDTSTTYYLTDNRRYVTSTTYPDMMNFWDASSTHTYTELQQTVSYGTGMSSSWQNYTRTDERHSYRDSVYDVNIKRLSSALWSPVSRDCYTLDRDFGAEYTTTVHANEYYTAQSDRRYVQTTEAPDILYVTLVAVVEPTYAAWAAGGWSYEPPVGTHTGAAGDAIVADIQAAITDGDPPLGSGGYSYPIPASSVTVTDRAASRPLVTLTASGHTVSPANVLWDINLTLDWSAVNFRTIPFDVRYSVFGTLPQIAYPHDTTGTAKSAVTGTAFLSDVTPNATLTKYSFVGYI